MSNGWTLEPVFERTEALGLSLISFLRRAGVELIPGTTTMYFVKRSDEENRDV